MKIEQTITKYDIYSSSAMEQMKERCIQTN